MIHDLYISSYASNTKETLKNMTPSFKSIVDSGSKAKEASHTLDWISKRIVSGYTVNFGAVKHKTITMIDVDNSGSSKATWGELLKLLKKNNLEPAYIFETLSSTLSHPRYHILFVLSEAIADEDKYKNMNSMIVSFINENYPGCCDIKCVSAKTIFYPCSSIVYQNKEAVIDPMLLISLFEFDVDSFVKLDFKKFIAPLFLDKKIYSPQEYEKIISKELTEIVIPISKTGHRINNPYLTTKKNSSNAFSLKDKNPLRGRLAFSLISEQSSKPLISRCCRLCGDEKTLLKSLNLSNLLNKKLNVFFDDIFGEKDSEGNIYRAIISKDEKDNFYKYHRYSKNDPEKYIDSFDIFNIIKKIYKTKNLDESIRLINHICNIDTQKYTVTIVRRNLGAYLKGLDRISKDSYPYLYEFLHRGVYTYADILKCIIEEYLSLMSSFENSAVTHNDNIQLRLYYDAIKRNYDKKHEKPISIHMISDKVHELAKLGLFNIVDKSNYNYRNRQTAAKTPYGNTVVFNIPFYYPFMFKVANDILEDRDKSNKKLENNYSYLMAAPRREREVDIIGTHIRAQTMFSREFIFIVPELYELLLKEAPKLSWSSAKLRFQKYLPQLLDKYDLRLSTLKPYHVKRYGLDKIIQEKNYKIGRTKVLLNASNKKPKIKKEIV